MTNGYNSYHGRGPQRTALVVAVVIVVLAVAGFFVYAWFNAPARDNTMGASPVPDATPSASPTLIIEHSAAPSAVPPSPEPSGADRVARPTKITAVYLPDVRDAQSRNGILQLCERQLINTVVIDVKDDEGKLAFVSESEIAAAAGANADDGADVAALVDELHEKGIYVIARMAVFEESLVSNQFRSMSVSTQNGTRWLDWQYHGWLDPYNDDVRGYVKELCTEVCDLGFDEILLDSFCFPTRGRPDMLYYEQEATVRRTDTLLELAGEIAELLDGYGVLMNIGCTTAEASAPPYAAGLSRELLSVGELTVWADSGTAPIHNALARTLLHVSYSDAGAAVEISNVLAFADDFGGVVLVGGGGLYPSDW